jgi:hypothetical protein
MLARSNALLTQTGESMRAAGLSCTSFDRLQPLAARAVLCLMLLVALGSIGITLSPLRSGFADAADRGPGDLALYRAKVRRIRAGESYYEAANAELRQRGYPTRSLFNWRTPLPLWLLGKAPHPLCGRVLLGLLALVATCRSFAFVEREASLGQSIGCGLLLLGAFLPCVLDGLYVAPELWAAAFITLSLCAYDRERPLLGVLWGVTALFFRDLAGLYCLVMGLMALANRRWREVLAWFLGLLAYAAFFAWHAANVLPLIGADDIAHRGSWLQLGGLPFVLSTCQMNSLLLLLPQWVTAIYFTMALVGLAGWQSPTGQRIGLVVCTYLALLAAVGHPFNQYWGSLFAPLLCFGVARFPATLAELWRRTGLQDSRDRLKTCPTSVQ